MTSYYFASTAIWITWIISWLAGGLLLRRGRTVKRPSVKADFGYRLITMPGFVLLFLTWHVIPGTTTQLWRLPNMVGWTFVALCASGLALTWWARLHLGQQWSPGVTVKESHRLIASGPYGLVRHPMYLGIMLGGISYAAIRGAPIAVIGASMLVIGFTLKARLEEQFLSDALGREGYGTYRNRIAMIVPWL